jgi:hypothetical protein
MKRTAVRAYRSPTLVLLALDWADRDDFLGLAVERTPGMRPSLNEPQAPKSWLPNRVGFDGPPADGQADFPSNTNPIQKFQWWDAAYLAEFMRLYEHYRARTYTLSRDARWTGKAYKKGTPEWRARVAVAKG